MKIESIILVMSYLVLTINGCKVKSDTASMPIKNENITIKTSPRADQSKSLIHGIVKFKESGEIVPFCNIVLKQNENVIAGAMSDLEGNFRMEGEWIGEFTLVFSYVGTPNQESTIRLNAPTDVQVEALMTESEIIVLKPIIYLYPEEEQDISVRLNYNGELLFSYPEYPQEGWKVHAEPDGTLWDEKGQEYYALFWEGKADEPIIPENGFVVKGTDTAKFLEEKLAYLGLNRREANEFIMFWLPRLQNNPYNLIHFAGSSYEEQAVLDINPKPETSIRVMMIYQPLQNEINFPLQDLSEIHKVRKGYTVVEWGGSEVFGIAF
jgi:hypothetical protein